MSLRQGSPYEHRSAFARKMIIRCFLLLLLFTLLHFLFVLLDGSRKCADGTICFTHKVYHGIFSLGERGSQKFSAYEESLQIQVRKTLTPGIKKLWTSKDWRNKVDKFWFFLI